MSLIGDALRKTRQEATERDGDRKGVLFSAKIAERPTSTGLGLGLVLGALIAIIATVAGGGAVWWVVGGKRAQEQPPTMSESASVPATADSSGDQEQPQRPADNDTDPDRDRLEGPATPPDSPATSDGIGKPQPETEAVTESPVESDSADRGRNARSSMKDVSRDPDPVSDSMNSPQAIAPEAGYVGTEDGTKVYLMEADLGDVTLSLDFIVFRPTDPYAEINGIEVHIGGTVAGFRVKSVERDRVVLSDGRTTITLRAP